jgi:hypothetical protein
MKKILLFSFIGIGTSLFTACKKGNDPEPVQTKEYTKADDAAARNELNRVYQNIEDVYNSDSYANARTAVVLPCGNVTLTGKNYTIAYGSGTNCGGRVLSGDINVELVSGTKFSDVGAKLKITFTNYKVVFSGSNQALTYSGIAYVTNTSGGTLYSLFANTTPTTVIHNIRGDISVVYDTAGVAPTPARSWTFFRKKTYTGTGTSTGVSLKVEGDTSFTASSYFTGSASATGTFSSVTEVGYNKDGKKFVNDVPTAFVWSNCGSDWAGPYILKQGKVEHTAYYGSWLLLTDVYGKFTADAGYKDNENTLDGSCNSNGYKLTYELKNGFNATTPIYSKSAFQAY